MTEHSKSLIERADGLFAKDGFVSAPVPRDLAKSAVHEPVAPIPVAQEPAKVSLKEQEAVVSNTAEKLVFLGEKHHVDRALLEEYGLINPDGPATTLMEEFRIVKRQVLQAARAGDDKARRVLITSPFPNEGKTFCAVNLALAMAAERDCEVLLVDADVAKPSILSTLGLPRGAGLMDALANDHTAVEDCVIATDIPNLFVLPAGNRTNADSEYLASNLTEVLFDTLTAGAPERIVIFDSPPALAASPAAELANHVGQTVVVARADKTGQSALEDALSLLSTCPDIKLLLNDASFSPSGRRFGDYYGYEG